MKKRVKLLTTIASLCLAVALMAFGVYAASQSTLNVTSHVSFESVGVNVTWNWEVTGGKLTGAITDSVSSDATKIDAETLKAEIAEVELSAENQKVTYSFTVTNNGEAPIDVVFTLPVVADGDNVKLTVIAPEAEDDADEEDTTVTVEDIDTTYTFTWEISIVNVAKSVDYDANCSFLATRA